MSMLPDGAETQLDDWTVFFLNQTPFNTISPVLALDTPEVKSSVLPGESEDQSGKKQELLCVLNLVRTKHDKTWDRYASSIYSTCFGSCFLVSKWRQSIGSSNLYSPSIYTDI